MNKNSGVVTVTEENFEDIIHNNLVVFMDFWAKWCEPCKVFAKIYKNIAQEFPQICFSQVDVEDQTKLAETFQISSIPHLLVFKQGIIIYSDSGTMPASTLQDLVKQALTADVDAL